MPSDPSREVALGSQFGREVHAGDSVKTCSTFTSSHLFAERKVACSAPCTRRSRTHWPTGRGCLSTDPSITTHSLAPSSPSSLPLFPGSAASCPWRVPQDTRWPAPSRGGITSGTWEGAEMPQVPLTDMGGSDSCPAHQLLPEIPPPPSSLRAVLCCDWLAGAATPPGLPGSTSDPVSLSSPYTGLPFWFGGHFRTGCHRRMAGSCLLF